MTPKYERQPTTLHIIRRGLSIPYPLMVDLNIPHIVNSCGLYTYNASFDIPELFLKIFRIPITPNEASNHVSTWTTIINESSLAFDLLSWNTSGIFSFYFFGGVQGGVGSGGEVIRNIDLLMTFFTLLIPFRTVIRFFVFSFHFFVINL